ncbi:hypothetical protein [Ancylobacter pratisalsi]|uniref:DUF982 domain-containing protein n=1 Tax=Ancylobacter pratisalsi TaxID=1745854 RepID=A0A6P1YR11_9HYPH|nr:hypothetical protein [Ancylobacter pratisalsi]QIB35819.1 hypothetical protein G3A50_20465 [Ancylobacter pratisalsi]
MTTTLTETFTSPLVLRIGSEDIEITSLDGAVDLIRSLRHDHLGRYAEMLLTQMESARTTPQKAEAWVAFKTWSAACGLQPHNPGWRHAA